MHENRLQIKRLNKLSSSSLRKDLNFLTSSDTLNLALSMNVEFSINVEFSPLILVSGICSSGKKYQLSIAELLTIYSRATKWRPLIEQFLTMCGMTSLSKLIRNVVANYSSNRQMVLRKVCNFSHKHNSWRYVDIY